jgi:transitional endoplasmic reticulum ATPase
MVEAIVKLGDGPRIKAGGIAMSRDMANKLGIDIGAPVLLIGKRDTVAVVESIEETEGAEVYLGRIAYINAQADEIVRLERLDKEAIAEKITLIQDGHGEVELHSAKGLLVGLRVCEGDRVEIANNGSFQIVRILNTQPRGVVQISLDTEITIVRDIMQSNSRVGFTCVGGYRETLQVFRELELRLANQPLLEGFGSGPIKGVLLYGPSGSGKTLILRGLMMEAKVNCILVRASQLAGLPYGESERRFKDVFTSAKEHSPSIICIDDLDAICTRRNTHTQPDEKRLLSVISELMDELQPESRLMVIATASSPESIDPLLRRPGRLDKEIELSLPNVEDRAEILKMYSKGFMLDKDLDLTRVAELTQGYTGADLELLARDALWMAIKRNIDLTSPSEEISREMAKNVVVQEADFVDASREINPVYGRAIIADIPQVSWDEVAGYKKLKSQIEKDVVVIWENRRLAKKLGLELPKGILFCGPPGVGKTHLAKALATRLRSKVIVVRASNLLSKWLGEYEQNIARVFEVARKTSPVVVIMDEVDSIAARRGSSGDASRALDSGLNVLLQQLDGIEASHDVLVICITNRRDVLDEAFVRSGRIGKEYFIEIPDREAREQIFYVHLNAIHATIAEDISLEILSHLTEGMVGADIKEIVRQATAEAFYEMVCSYVSDKLVVRKAHFQSALKAIKSRGDDGDALYAS